MKDISIEKRKLTCLDYGIDIQVLDLEIAEITNLENGINLYLIPTDNKIENNNLAIRLGIIKDSLEAEFLNVFLGTSESFNEIHDNWIGQTISLAFVSGMPLAIIKNDNICMIPCQLDKNLEGIDFYTKGEITSLTRNYLDIVYGISWEEFIELLKEELPKTKVIK